MTRNRELAADLTQDALVRAWRNRRSLRDARARRVWLFRIAVNLFEDHRRRTPSTTTDEVDLTSHPAPVLSPDAIALHNELQDRVQAALDALPARQRQVMHLHIFEQLSPREMATVLNVDGGTIRSNLAAARKRLRTQFPDLAQPAKKQQSSPSASRMDK